MQTFHAPSEAVVHWADAPGAVGGRPSVRWAVLASSRYPTGVTQSSESRQPAPLELRTISSAEHTAHLAAQPLSSFLQNPRWPAVKTEWEAEHLGVFAGDELIAAALVLHRQLPIPGFVPGLGKKRLSYIAEGPVFDATQHSLAPILEKISTYLTRQGAFLIRMGVPGILRRWEAKEVRRALAAGEHHTLDELEPLDGGASPWAQRVTDDLRAQGWQPPATSTDFEAGQPQFQARIPLVDESGEGLDVDGVLSRMDQTSRRQTRKSTRSELEISVGTAEDLPAWQALYEETAERDGFTGRPLEYFQRMHRELNASELSECTLYLAHFEGQLLAAAIYVRQGEFGWYVYGASSGEERKRYAPRALQLRQIEDSLAAGCHWYDLGGLSPSLAPDHELAGLTRFKTTMGADVVQTFGEWDLTVNPLLAKAFSLYMARR